MVASGVFRSLDRFDLSLFPSPGRTKFNTINIPFSSTCDKYLSLWRTLSSVLLRGYRTPFEFSKGRSGVKWVALILFMMAVPTLAGWLRTNPPRAHLAWAALTFLPFVIGPWHLIVSPYATPMWTGYVKGWEFSLLDAVALGVLLGTRRPWPRLTLAAPYLAYVLAVVLSLWQARFFNLALSYPIQLVRVGLVMLAIARVSTSERGERAIVTGLIAGIAIQALYAIVARASGALQTGGSLGHQNLLGFVSHMVLMPSFAMLLAGRWPKTAAVGVLAGLIAVILTVSRATIFVSAVGLILTLGISLVTRMTGRKAAMSLMSLVVLGLSAPVAYAAIQQRLRVQNINLLGEDGQREAFERAARLMIEAKPMGVGPNHYNFIANTEGYSERAGVSWSIGNRTANVHNNYLLICAETGYLGLITMIVMLGLAIFFAFTTAFRFKYEPGAEILIGVGVGLVAISLHGFFEWMFVVYPSQYVLAALLGLTIGLRSRFLSTGKKKRHSRQPSGMTRTAVALPA